MTGGEFLMKHVKSKDSMKCHFSVTRDGRPVKIQRQIFSECFYLQGLAELARATKEDKYKVNKIINKFCFCNMWHITQGSQGAVQYQVPNDARH